MVSAIDSTDIVYKAKALHHTSSSATAAFGRLLTGASLMGAQLKQKNASLSLRVQGGGEIVQKVAFYSYILCQKWHTKRK
jgi:molecular chaperone Hsp33